MEEKENKCEAFKIASEKLNFLSPLLPLLGTLPASTGPFKLALWHFLYNKKLSKLFWDKERMG